MPLEQTLIRVDGKDAVLGYAPRSSCHLGDGLLHRAVLLLVHNSQGKLLLQKRKASLWDGYWDLSGATHPLHSSRGDESYAEAAQRVLAVEWGIRAPVKPAFLFVYFAKFGSHCENELCELLLCTYDGVVAPNPEHAHSMRWATFEECQRELQKDASAYTPWAKVALEALAKSEPLLADLAHA